VGPVERRGPPQLVDVEHLAGDVDEPVAGDLLEDQVHREQRREVVGPDRLERARVQRRWWRRRQVGIRLYHWVGSSDSSRVILC
jgi:hypothetical protein